MEFKGEILSHLLRIITPRIIAELSTTSQGRKKVPLSSLIQTYCESGHYEDVGSEEEDETKAKILSFDQGLESESEHEEDNTEENNLDEEVQKETFYCATRAVALLSDFSRKCKSMDKNVLGPKRLPKKKLSDSVISIEDILEQKKKFERSYGLMKSKEVLDLYQSTAKSNVTKTNEESSREDEFCDGERGVLINKKQA